VGCVGGKFGNVGQKKQGSLRASRKAQSKTGIGKTVRSWRHKMWGRGGRGGEGEWGGTKGVWADTKGGVKRGQQQVHRVGKKTRGSCLWESARV